MHDFYLETSANLGRGNAAVEVEAPCLTTENLRVIG
jgi:hypothetical protein